MSSSTNSWNWAARTTRARNRPRQGGLLVRDLGGVVAARELVDPYDRNDDQPPHAGPLTGLLQVAGGGREEIRRGLLIGRGRLRAVTYRMLGSVSEAAASPSTTRGSTATLRPPFRQ